MIDVFREQPFSETLVHRLSWVHEDVSTSPQSSCTHRCRSRQFLRVHKDILPEKLLRQTFSLHIFCSCWYILFSSTMLP